MQLHFSLKQQEFIEASILHEQQGSRVLTRTVLFTLLLGYFLFITDFSNNNSILSNAISLVVSFIVFIVLQNVIYTFLQKGEFRKNPELSKEVRYHISDAGIHCDDAFTPWDEISKWKQDAHNTLIYTDINHFYIIPTRILDEAQEEKLSKYLNEKVSQVA